MLASTSPKEKTSPSRSQYAGPTQPIPKKSLQIRTDKPRPHVCSICTRAFARLEHLKRHERSHTNEKPFQCAACGRCFARRDLVLRHQQKLHLNIFLVVRRGLLPTTLPQLVPESSTSTPTGDNIIILQNNTSAKAPLPNQSGVSSPNLNTVGLGTPLPTNGAVLPNGFTSQLSGLYHHRSLNSSSGNSHGTMVSSNTNSSGNGSTGFLSSGNPHDSLTIPSPNTNSSHNTPSFNMLGNNYSSSYPELDPLSVVDGLINPDMTQQPSPLTGDSPDMKEKKSVSKLNSMNGRNNDPRLLANVMGRFSNNSSLSGTNPGYANQRHASFSAVSGISYTNLQDAMAIRNTQFTEVPQQVGFATPQMTADEIETKGFQVEDFGNLDLDWYSIDYGTHPPNKGPAASLATRRLNRTDSAANGFKIKLNTIPSELQLQVNDPDYYTSNIVAAHQFLDPSHPHHIKGTTPLEFGYSSFTDVASMLGSDSGKNIQVGTGFAHLAHDMIDLEESRQTSHGPNSSAASGIPSGRETKMKQQHSSQSSKRGSVPNVRPPSGLRRRSLTILNTDYKRADLDLPTLSDIGSVSNLAATADVGDLAWVDVIRELPVPSEFPLATRNTGFDGFPYINDQFGPDEVYTLFKQRQNDLVKQRSTVNAAAAADDNYSVSLSTDHNHGMERTSSKVKFTIGDSNEVFSEELRTKIVQDSKLNEGQFPPCEDLNGYLNLYEKEFNTYFPFIHMPTLKNLSSNNFENVPLILSMCAIGALYLYHDSNTLLLFNLSKFHIHNFFEKEVTVDKLQFKKVPIMAHQCLVLHIFISMFLNEPNMVEITSRQMNSMVGLIKLTNFHRPLEQFLVPPAKITGPHDHAGIQSNFDYFIMTQTRIRTIHTFYQLEVLRSALLGCPLPMSGSEVKCGTQSNDEKLWRLLSAEEWYRHYQLHDRNKSLVELSNNESMSSLFKQLSSGFLGDDCISFGKLLALIMHVHEQILNEFMEGNSEIDSFVWRVKHRPRLENLLKLWESYFIRNGGFSLLNNHNHHLLNTRSELKLILPMSLLAKMRICVNFTPVLTQVLYKDWPGMEAMLKKLDSDTDALKEAANYSMEVLNLWVHNISMLNDAKQTSVRTPVFFVTCIFVSVVILSKVLKVIENSKTCSILDRAFWLSCVEVLNRIETALSPKEESSYSEFLREQSHGVFDYAWGPEFKQNVDSVVRELIVGDSGAVAGMQKCNLSIYGLGLGVRILADAPLWPLAMGFAEALKNMAIQFNDEKN